VKFVTFQSKGGGPRAGLVRGDSVIDLSAELAGRTQGSAPLDMLHLITNMDELLPLVREVEGESTRAIGDRLHLLEAVRLCPPIPRPPKNVMCLGRNYPEHASESARAFGDASPPQARPEFPTIFTKSANALVGPYDDIVIDPDVSTAMDWEVELALVIGKPGKGIPIELAREHVFGYMVLNDVTARDLQRRYGGQFFKGKSLDLSTPTGPWIVTPDEVGALEELALSLRVNGVLKQHDRVGSMMFSVPEIISALSVGLTLEPGDIVATGTPAGVGFAREPREFLKAGDRVEAEISGLGTLRNYIVGPK